MNEDTWIVVPMYNEASTIQTVIQELRHSFLHVVCVDDGSSDRSPELAEASGATVLRHPLNLGQGAALQTGIDFALQFADAAFVVTFDADGQHQVEDALAMLRGARQSGIDVTLGSRFLEGRPAMPASRRLALRCAVAFTNLTTGLTLTDAHNGLRVFSRRAAEAVDIHLHRMAHASEILSIIARQRLTHIERPVSVRYTEYSLAKGQTNLNAVNILFDLLLQRLRVAS